MSEVITEDRIREIIKEELANFVPPKKKRGPNKWQLFLSDCAKRQPAEFAYPDKVKACSMEYKASKKNGNGNQPNHQHNHQSNQTQLEQQKSPEITPNQPDMSNSSNIEKQET